ncbi:helix-turn-helix domain-containing protein [Virgibacillus sp. W0181]|uniref:helix-turn-helix domain-containing protein n=1 Tax=Virgibacillus sp. W0181 TaxID=3391581 RepID=UPI003F483A3A
MEIGERLKEAREEKGVSLDHLQDTTKIQKRYLIAIEEGNYSVLPGKFYAKAFIKEYANAVGLNAQELLEDFVEKTPVDEDNSIPYTRIQRSQKTSGTKTSSMFSFIPTVIVIVLVIGIFFVAWSLYQQSAEDGGTEPVDQQEEDKIIRNVEEDPKLEEGTENTSDNEQQEDESETPEAEEDTTNADFQVVEEGSGKSPESTLKLSNAGETVEIVIKAEGDSYIDVKGESGESYFSGTLTPSESPVEMEVSGEEKVYFNVGNASNATISMNDIEMEYPVDANKYVHQKIWVQLD